MEMMLYLVCVLEWFKGFTEEHEGLGDDASSEKLSSAKNLEMNWLAENWERINFT
jgi:hypothetical protein